MLESPYKGSQLDKCKDVMAGPKTNTWCEDTLVSV